MLNVTEEHFRNKLLRDINRLCSVCDNLSFEKDKLDDIFILYKRYRDIIHSYLEQGSNEYKDVIKMDRHKVAAAFFCSIIKAKPIARKTAGIKFFERTANEQLALMFSVLYIIDLFNISDSQNTEVDKEVYNLPFRYPKCQHSKSKSYKINFLMLIDETQKRLLDIDSNEFKPSSLFSISHLFFLLDAYSYQENLCLLTDSDFIPAK